MALDMFSQNEKYSNRLPCCQLRRTFRKGGAGKEGLPSTNPILLFFTDCLYTTKKSYYFILLVIAFLQFSWICLKLQEEMSFHMRKLPNGSLLIRSKPGIDLWNHCVFCSLVLLSLNGNFVRREPGDVKSLGGSHK